MEPLKNPYQINSICNYIHTEIFFEREFKTLPNRLSLLLLFTKYKRYTYI